MNHREQGCFFGKGAGVTLLLILLSLINFNLKLYSQKIISRDIIDYPGGSVSSQCSSTPSAGCIINLPPAKYGESYSFTVPILSSILRSDVTFNFTQKSACSDGSISFTSDGNIEIQSASSCNPQTNNFIEIDLKAISSNLTDSIKYYLPILREPVKVVLVLDISGSMALPVTGGTAQRWDVIKKSIDLFTQKLEVFKEDGDRIGLTYFSTEVTQPGSPIGSDFIDITSEIATLRSSSTIHADMSVKGPSNRTAMGKGLLDAKHKLGDNNSIDARKLVLLFTDGLQNEEPLVNSDGVTLSAGTDLLNAGPCPASDSVRYYTIGIGGTNLVPEILGQIAHASGGVSLVSSTGNQEDEIEYFFQNQFVNMLEGSSPQIVARKEGVLSSTGTKHSFPINTNVSKLYFELTTSGSAGASFKLEKGGKDFTSYAKINDGTFYKSLSLSLPVSAPEQVNPEGDWELTVFGNSMDKYSLVCYVDDHFLNFDCKPAKSVFTVGEKIVLSTKLTFAGKPLSGEGNVVKVTLIKPGDDIGDLLAKTKVNTKDSVIDISSGADTKSFYLLKDPTILKKLAPSTHTIELEDAGDGIFTGEYDNTEVSGVYQLIFTVNGDIEGFGKFERQKQFSTVFKFGQISLKKSNLIAKLNISKKAKDPSTATITFMPCNDFGHYLGPGFLSRIKVSVDANQGKLTSKKDNLDGSYTFIISDIPQGVKPDLRIMVLDEMLYLGKFPSPRLYAWQYLVLLVLIVALVFLYIFAHTGQTSLRTVLWILILLWILFMVLQRLGYIIF